MQNKRKTEEEIIELVTAAQSVPMLAAPLPVDDLLSDADDAEVEAAAMLKETRLSRANVKRGKGNIRENDETWSQPTNTAGDIDLTDPDQQWRCYEHPTSGKDCHIPPWRSHGRDSVRRGVSKKRFHGVMERIAKRFADVGLWTECHRVSWYLYMNNKAGDKAMKLMTTEKKQALLSVMPGNVVLTPVVETNEDAEKDVAPKLVSARIMRCACPINRHVCLLLSAASSSPNGNTLEKRHPHRVDVCPERNSERRTSRRTRRMFKVRAQRHCHHVNHEPVNALEVKV